jgi:hypothetical protein
MAEQFVDRQSLYPNRFKITRADGTAEYVTLERADEPTVEGTLLNAAVFNDLVDELASTKSEVIPMTRGGTGATNGANGLKNLFAAGATVLSTNQYGDTLPNPGTRGRIFFLRVND